MSLYRAWMSSVGLLLVLSCGEKSEPPESPGPESGRDAAIAAIEKLGGEVGYDEESPDRSIATVRLTGTKVTDAHLVHLKGLTSLGNLELRDTQITDAGLEHLKGMTSLRDLHLWNTRVTDDGVKKLQEALPNCRARLGTDHF